MGYWCCLGHRPVKVHPITKGDDPQALPKEIARRAALKEKLDAACARLEAEAKAAAEAERPDYEEKKAAYEVKKGRRGRPPKPPDETPPPDRQSNLTDPNSQPMRKSKHHEYRQACNAQAVVWAEGTKRSWPPTWRQRRATSRPARRRSWRCRTRSACRARCWLMPAMPAARRWPRSRRATSRRWCDRAHPAAPAPGLGLGKLYDFRPPPEAKVERPIREPWRLAMKEKLES